MQLAFGQIDNDGSKSIDVAELLGYYGHVEDVSFVQPCCTYANFQCIYLLLPAVDKFNFRFYQPRTNMFQPSSPQRLKSSPRQIDTIRDILLLCGYELDAAEIIVGKVTCCALSFN
jgi:hypothetical protein